MLISPQKIFIALNIFFILITPLHADPILEKMTQEQWQQIIEELATVIKQSPESQPILAIVDVSFQDQKSLIPQKKLTLQRELTNQLQKSFPEQVVAFDDMVTAYEEWTLEFPDSAPPDLWFNLSGIVGAELIVVVAISQEAEQKIQIKVELYNTLISQKTWKKIYHWDVTKPPIQTIPLNNSNEIQKSLNSEIATSDHLIVTPFDEEVTNFSPESDIAIDSEKLFDEEMAPTPIAELPEDLKDENMVLILFESGQDFLIDKTEVTVEDFQKCTQCQKGTGQFESQNLDAPVFM